LLYILNISSILRSPFMKSAQ